MHARFYAPDANAPGDVVTLPDEEAKHLTRVLRLGCGDRVRAFNGRGLEFEGVVAEAPARRSLGEGGTRGAVALRLEAPVAPAPEPSVAITLIQAVLKGDNMDASVRDAVMLGAVAILPIVTTRTELSLAALARGHRRERWQRIAISSTKQCGRAVVPVIHEACAFEIMREAIAQLTLPSPALMLVEPGASPAAVPLTETSVPRPSQASLLVGPEGGWTREEIESTSGICRLVSLGQRTLRADAMALVALSAVFTLWKEF